MRRELAARDFGSLGSMENEGILYVFPVFHTAPVGQKIRCPAEVELFRGSLRMSEAMTDCIAIKWQILVRRNEEERPLGENRGSFRAASKYVL